MTKAGIGHQRRARRQGFTLLELMVALTVGGIAITSIYAIGAATTRQFHQQQSVAGTQSSVRDALDRVKRDIARAGYLSTPNANVADDVTGLPIEGCGTAAAPLDDPTGGGRLAAISQFTNDLPALTGTDPTGDNVANGFTHDEIRLIANYQTSDQYPGVRLPQGSNNSVLVPQDWHAFRRDFTDWYVDGDYDHNDLAFNDAFTIGRMIRIMTTTRKKHFATLTAVADPGDAPQGADDPALLTFNPPIPAGCLKDVDGGWVAPVNVIRYFLQDAPDSETGRFSANTGPMAQLIRQETLPGDKGVPLANNPAHTRAVLDFAVSFNLRFQLTADTAAGEEDSYTLNTLTNSAPAVNGNPEWVRAVEIDLAARTALSDPRFMNPWVQASCADQLCFQVFDEADNQGAARVRRARAVVFLPNVAFEGY
ncbi:MAG: prepilin-type N-terminal cleavage/methylation domain-containing protein [Myxococcales bacterium]|nr:prepilin-type N-terminal cleavage/methylation domain-containing protein [Myxococcales bacterium]